MLALILVAAPLLAGVTEVGPDLVERFDVPAAGPGAFVAFSESRVATASHNRLLLHSPLDGAAHVEVHLPCDARGLVVDKYRWAVACDDRVLLGESSTFEELKLDGRGRTVVAFGMELFFRNWAVAFHDGTLLAGDDRGGRMQLSSGGRKVLALGIDGISDVIARFDDGTAARYSGGRASGGAALPRPTLVEVFEGSDGKVRGRVSVHVVAEASRALVAGRVVERASLPPDVRPDALVSSTVGVEAMAVAPTALCMVHEVRLTCLGPHDPRAENAVALDRDGRPSREVPVIMPPAPPPPPPTLASTPNVVNLASAGVGLVALGATPFVLHAMSPGTTPAGAAALSLLAAGAGLGTTAVVVGVTVTAVGIVALAAPRERAHGSDLFSAIAADISNAVSDCAAALVMALVVVAATVAVAAVGVAWLSAASMPAVDVALGGTPPARDPLLPTLVGAASGGTLGLLVAGGVSFTTWPLREGESEDQATLSGTVDAVHVAAWILGAGALGGVIGYGVGGRP